MAESKDFQMGVKQNWCPGCGHFATQTAIQRAAANLNLSPDQLALISGIGCSGRISGYVYAYGFHSIHGRALPIAQGVKMANRDLTVVAAGGDGDGLAIGIGHLIHAIRRNIDITYIIMDNHVYGLTKGQTSPRSDMGFKTKTSPHGSIEAPLSVMEMALTAGVTYAAQGFSSNLKELTSLIEQGMRHKGFALINVFTPCVTFNKVNDNEWYRNHLVGVEQMPGYNRENPMEAMQALMNHRGLLTGVVFQDKTRPSYQDLLPGYSQEPLAQKEMAMSRKEFDTLLTEFM